MQLVWKLAGLWSVNDPLPEIADLMVAVAHGATSTGITRGARAVTNYTCNILSYYNHSPLLSFGAFGGSKNVDAERTFKKRRMLSGTYIGVVWSTIEECRKVKEYLPTEFSPKVVVVVTDQAHSRRCRIVWRTFFPDTDIRIISIDLSSTIDPNSPMTPYHSAWKALAFQVLPTPFYWFMSLFGEKGLLLIEGLHQPTKK